MKSLINSVDRKHFKSSENLKCITEFIKAVPLSEVGLSLNLEVVEEYLKTLESGGA